MRSNFRGQTRPYRARGRGRGRDAWAKVTAHTPSPPSGRMITSLSSRAPQLNHDGRSAVEISDCRFVGAYNWINAPNPTIIVPGAPPEWAPVPTPVRLSQDGGKYYRDPNAARYPSHPIEPAVLSIFETTPDIDPQAVDVFGCSSTLGNLFRFVRGTSQAFRFSVELIGRTLFLVRQESSPQAVIEGIYGHGHTFLERFTNSKPDLCGVESSQRLIEYQFCGMTFVVRFEVDAQICERGSTTNLSQTEEEKDATLEDRLESLSTIHEPQPGTVVSIRKGGWKVSEAEVLDIKTRSFTKNRHDVLEEQLPRLWMRQIPNFVLAYHREGIFEDVTVENLRDRIKTWEQENGALLGRYAKLVQYILETARKSQRGKLDIYASAGGPLELREVVDQEWSALTPGTRNRWEGVSPSDQGTDDSNASHPNSPNIVRNEHVEPRFADDDDEDYTACSVSCGYCGRCSY